MKLIRKVVAEFRQLHWSIKSFVILAVVFGSLFRYINLFNLGYYFDMVETQYTWGKGAFEQGVFGFWQNYPMAKHYDYPPISLIYEYFVYGFSKLFSGDNVQVFVIIIKSVNWFFDAVMAAFFVVFGQLLNNRLPIKPIIADNSAEENFNSPEIMQIHSNNGDTVVASTSEPVIASSFQDLKIPSSSFNPASLGWVLASFFYLVPSSWFVSGVWGQNDTLMVFITLICLLILVTRFFNGDTVVASTEPNINTNMPVIASSFQDLKSPEIEEIPDQARNDKFILTNQYFLVGVLLAIGFWIKQQPILLVPILGLIFIYNKSNKDIFKVILWVLPFIIISTLLGLFYNSEGREFGNNFNFLTRLVGFDYPVISNWGIIANFGTMIVFVIPLIILVYFELKLKVTTAWQDLRRFLLGFWLVSTIIAIPSVISNYQRFARVTFASVIRGDSIANGATTFWGIFKELKTANDLILGLLPLKHVALIIYLILIGFLLWRYLQLDIKKLRTLDFKIIFAQKLNLFQLLAIMWVHTTCYFLFFPNMHSRYLHFGIIYSLVVTFFLPLKNRLVGSLWITGLILLNIFYSLNQFLVFGSNNSNPSWVKNSIDWFSTDGRNIDAWWLSSVGIFVSFVLMYGALVVSEVYHERKV